LVAFVGGGPGFHFSVGVGVGWFPLAPGDVYVPAYRVSRTYVNNVNITNTSVNITKVTNVYNTVIVNKTTTINNITYVNQHVSNGVTVVSHDTFVNAQPVASNVMKVEPREILAAPVSHVVVAEPVRASVVGAGRPVSVKPPATVISRQVVAVRTPPPLPRSIEQRQAEAGGHLYQQQLARPVVHPMAPAQPAPVNQAGRPSRPESGFKPFGTPSGGNTNGNTLAKPMLKPQPRVYEEQGTSQPESRNVQPPPTNRNAQAGNQEFKPPQPADTHPLVRPAPPVQERNEQQEQQQAQKFNQWQQQRPASPPPSQHQSQPKSSPPPRSESPKKNH